MIKENDIITINKYPIFVGKLLEIPENIKLISTINQYSYCVAEKDEEFKAALTGSDVLLPDGIGIVWAFKILKGLSVKKIAGADLHQFLLEKLNKDGGSCFYLGSTNNTLKLIKNRLSKEFPNVRVASYSPPFKPVFNEMDNHNMLEAINNFKPDVLFIGMTAPKQEKWAFQHCKRIESSLICSIGAVFDFYAGTINRPNKFWIKYGLEWFFRLLKEPKRMWRRYLYYGPVFIFLILKKKVFYSLREI